MIWHNLYLQFKAHAYFYDGTAKQTQNGRYHYSFVFYMVILIQTIRDAML